MIIVLWQAWIDIREEAAVVINICCHDVGLRKQHLGYHNSWDCWYVILLLWYWALRCVDVGSA